MLRLIPVLFCFGCGITAAYFATPFAYQNKEVLAALVTTFTVFGGFLIGVVTLMGDPSIIPSGSWRTAEQWRARIDGPLSRQRALFYLYVITLGFLIVSLVTIEPAGTHLISDGFKIWITRIYVTLSVFSFLLTLGLPLTIVQLQKERFGREVEARRKKEGISD